MVVRISPVKKIPDLSGWDFLIAAFPVTTPV
jgi:hypothetical protein